MKQAEVEIFVDDACEHVIVRLTRARAKPVGIELDPASAERFALLIARHRAALNDPVRPSLDFNARLEITPDPSWVVGADSQSDRRLLLLRHPGLGWMTFSLTRPDAAHLAATLTTDARIRA